MQRVDNSPSNLYEDGDPSQGKAGTLVKAAKLNALQEEICSVIEGSDLTLDPLDNSQLWQAITQQVPAGLLGSWSGETPPDGWLERDGSAISRTTYAALFAHLGCRHGRGDGATTFNLPDDRGKFPRYWDHGAGVDPDASSRTSPFVSFNLAGNTTSGSNVITGMADTDDLVVGFTVTGSGIPASTEIYSIDSSSQITLTQAATATAAAVSLTFELIGDHVGTEQDHQLDDHHHAIDGSSSATGAGVSTVNMIPQVTDNGATKNTDTSGGSETRPVNNDEMPIIKY